MPKPHRVLLDQLSGYADEAAAFMRRRRHTRRPFARVYYADGSASELPQGTGAGDALYAATRDLIELAGSERPARRSKE